jgi:putative effector of murein hydrolase LrgA (UPF0299 family)
MIWGMGAVMALIAAVAISAPLPERGTSFLVELLLLLLLPLFYKLDNPNR